MASNGASPKMSLLGLAVLVLSTVFVTETEALTFRPSSRDFLNAASVDCSAAFHGEILKVEGAPPAVRLGLVHKYGPCSPLKSKNSSAPVSEFTEEFRTHEANRVLYLQSKMEASARTSEVAAIRAPLISGNSVGSGSYLLKVGLGTPPKGLTLAIDTGSELAWTQCEPCASSSACYSQEDPIFVPTASSTYKPVPCGVGLCSKLEPDSGGSCSTSGVCEYVVRYLDSSFTTGDFATDTLTVGGATIPNYAFGCGHDNEGLFQGADGVLGLDKSALAFPAQTSSSYGEIFAYCLPSPFSSSSGFIEFGSSASPSASVTPLISASTYVVELDSVTVGDTSLTPSSSAFFIVDSGTVISRLNSALYVALRDAFKAGASGLTPAPSSAGEGLFDTCYTVGAAVTSIEIPKISFNLMGGVVFAPPASNLLYNVASGTYCLAFAPIQSSSDLSILGSYQQTGYRFAFDIPSSSLSIDPGAC